MTEKDIAASRDIRSLPLLSHGPPHSKTGCQQFLAGGRVADNN